MYTPTPEEMNSIKLYYNNIATPSTPDNTTVPTLHPTNTPTITPTPTRPVKIYYQEPTDTPTPFSDEHLDNLARDIVTKIFPWYRKDTFKDNTPIGNVQPSPIQTDMNADAAGDAGTARYQPNSIPRTPVVPPTDTILQDAIRDTELGVVNEQNKTYNQWVSKAAQLPVVKPIIDTVKALNDYLASTPAIKAAEANPVIQNTENGIRNLVANTPPEVQLALNMAGAMPVAGIGAKILEPAAELAKGVKFVTNMNPFDNPEVAMAVTDNGFRVPVSKADLEQGSSYAKATGNGGGSGNWKDRLKDIDEARLKAEQDSIDKGKQQAAEDIKNTDINSQYTQDEIKNKYQDALKENPVDVIKQNRMLGRNLTPIEFQSVDKLPIRKDNYEEVLANRAKELGGDPVNVVNDVRQRMVDVDKEWVEGMRYMYDNPGINKGLVAAISNPNRDFAKALKSTNGFKYVWKDGWEHPEILEGGPNDSTYIMHENYAREHGWDKNQESYGRWFVRNGYIKGEGYGSPSGPRLDMIGDNPHLMLKAATYFGR